MLWTLIAVVPSVTGSGEIADHLNNVLPEIRREHPSLVGSFIAVQLDLRQLETEESWLHSGGQTLRQLLDLHQSVSASLKPQLAHAINTADRHFRAAVTQELRRLDDVLGVHRKELGICQSRMKAEDVRSIGAIHLHFRAALTTALPSVWQTFA